MEREKNKKIEEVNKIEDSFDQEKMKEEIENNIKNAVSKEFRNVAYDNGKSGFEIDLVDRDIDTKEITENILSEFEIKSLFGKEIVSYLKQYNCLEEKSRKEEALNNMELIEYLKNMEYDFIFGRKSTINPIRYQNRGELDNYIKDNCTCFDYYEKNIFIQPLRKIFTNQKGVNENENNRYDSRSWGVRQDLITSRLLIFAASLWFTGFGSTARKYRALMKYMLRLTVMK